MRVRPIMNIRSLLVFFLVALSTTSSLASRDPRLIAQYSAETNSFCSALAAIWAHGDLADIKFTEASFDVVLDKEIHPLAIHYILNGAIPVLLDEQRAFTYVIDSSGRFLREATFELDSRKTCITPNQIQAFFGPIKTNPFMGPAGDNVGLDFVPVHVNPKITITFSLGSGCLSHVDIYQVP